MRIALVCPANIMHMPYLKNYLNILSRLHGVDCFLINWDRFGIEELHENTYRDNGRGHKRGFFQYYFFSKFVIRRLRAVKCDRIIVFGLQMIFFLNRNLKKNFSGNYLLDVRDHHKIVSAPGYGALIDASYFTIISSPAFRQWLPKSTKYLVNHNTSISVSEVSPKENEKSPGLPIVLSCVGALKDLEINCSLIDSLGNHEGYELHFNGEGVINSELLTYIKEKNVWNAYVTGRYQPDEEGDLYRRATIVNMLMSERSINNKTCLSNRLYNAVVHRKPLLTLSGSYIAEVVEKYKLGLVVQSLDGISDRVRNYLDKLPSKDYAIGRDEFLANVFRENGIFEEMLVNFSGASTQ